MNNYTKIYFRYFDYGESDRILCERCGSLATEIHHVYGRGKGKDVIENLIALCRTCHNLAHASKNYVSKKEFEEIHLNFIKRHETKK
jgi:5-methylcytosine-specific restriction endonuclease McrA